MRAVVVSEGAQTPPKNPIELSQGRFGGTEVHENLAIDYAVWIGPALKLHVYQGFKEADAYTRQR